MRAKVHGIVRCGWIHCHDVTTPKFKKGEREGVTSYNYKNSVNMEILKENWINMKGLLIREGKKLLILACEYMGIIYPFFVSQ